MNKNVLGIDAIEQEVLKLSKIAYIAQNNENSSFIEAWECSKYAVSNLQNLFDEFQMSLVKVTKISDIGIYSYVVCIQLCVILSFLLGKVIGICLSHLYYTAYLYSSQLKELIIADGLHSFIRIVLIYKKNAPTCTVVCHFKKGFFVCNLTQRSTSGIGFDQGPGP